MRRPVLIAAIALALIGFAVCQVKLPYGASHFQQIAASKLRGHLSAWKSSSAFPNRIDSLVQSGERSSIVLFRTNLSYQGRAYQSVLRLDSKNFRAEGFLVGTTNAEVFWVSKQGEVKLVEPRTEN